MAPEDWGPLPGEFYWKHIIFRAHASFQDGATPIRLGLSWPLAKLHFGSGKARHRSFHHISKDFAQTSHFKVPGSDKIKEKCVY